jgi:hypothetical protein
MREWILAFVPVTLVVDFVIYPEQFKCTGRVGRAIRSMMHAWVVARHVFRGVGDS